MPYELSKPYFKLFANCIAVKGASRSTICDLQRGNIQFITNTLYEILTEYKNCSLDQILEDYDEKSHQIILKYFTFLEEKQLGFWCSNPRLYPDLNLSWEAPSLITNAIIDANENSKHNYHNIMQQLNKLNCKALQLRYYDVLSLKELYKICGAIVNSRLRSFELFLKYSEEFSIEKCKEILLQTPVSAITVHSAPFDAVNIADNGYAATHTKKVIDSTAHCGIINQIYFAPNIPLFTESQQHNSCLNRKISIDINGDIKNCPSMTTSFGNICNTKLADVMHNEEFRSKWFIKKDQIKVCKDCEFRYVCTDCRAYTQNSDDQYSKPLKCNYDPYTATWK